MAAPAKDTRKKSAAEALVNSFGSYPIGYAFGLVIMPLAIGWLEEDLLVANLAVTLAYAVISFARSYYLRRIFERFGYDDNVIRLGKRLYDRIR